MTTLHTTAEVAAILSVSVKHVQRLYAKRLIVPIDVGIGRRKLRVTQAELERYVAGAVVGSKPSRKKCGYVAKVL